MKTYSARNFDSLISTSTRINAEPAPEVRPGDMGVRHDGRSSAPQEQIDIDAVVKGIAADLGMNSPSELARIRAAVERFGGRPPRTESGISTSDAIERARRQILGGVRDSDAVRSALRAGHEVRRASDTIAAMNRANAALWDRR